MKKNFAIGGSILAVLAVAGGVIIWSQTKKPTLKNGDILLCVTPEGTGYIKIYTITATEVLAVVYDPLTGEGGGIQTTRLLFDEMLAQMISWKVIDPSESPF